MTYGDKIRSMNDKELAEFISQCVIDDNEGEAMYIYGIGHFVWAEDLADKLGEEIKEDELPPVTATPSDPTSIRCNLDSNSGVIYKAEKTDSLSLTIVPLRVFNDNESFSVTVQAISSSPYVKTLSATFVITVGRRGIDYAITDSVGSPYFIFSITNALDTYKDIYEVVGVGDSVIRERIFVKLAEIMEVDYDYIYNQWLLS